jgi:hypothetical protein
MAITMKQTQYDIYWFECLEAVIQNPMAMAYKLAAIKNYRPGKFTHVLTILVKRGFVAKYHYEYTNKYYHSDTYYYATSKGQLLYLQTSVDKMTSDYNL